VRILLVSANRLAEPYPVYPIGLDYVRGSLPSRHPVEVLDLAVDAHDAAFESRVRDLNPELVGIALRNIDNTEAIDTRTFVQDYRALADRIRALTAAPIVLGGPAFTIAPAEMMEALDADYGIVGEGERLADLVCALEAGGDLDRIPGLMQPGQAANAAVPLQTPSHRALVEPGAQLEHYLGRSGMLNLQTQRGCPFRCIYCTYPLVEGRRVRPFEAPEVARVARALQDRGARYLFLTDAVFNADEDHGLAVAHAFGKVGLSIPWGAYFSPRTTDPAYWRSLGEAGLSHVEFGTDSLDETVLARYRKPFERDRAVAAHEAALTAGLHVAHFFTLGGPGESPDTLRRTFEAAGSLERCVCFFFAGVRVFPGTGLASEDPGQDPPLLDPLRAAGLEPIFYEPPGWSLSELQDLASEEIGRHPHWMLGSGGARLAKTMTRLYGLGYTGPLWEKLIR
jgi:radical SAM superfamily enzyme YgiQ (UPF0313 family)